MNALKHGLNARTVILPNEDDEYNFMLESYVERFQPADLVEMDLVVEPRQRPLAAAPLQ